MSVKHRKSLERILKKLEAARDSNLRLSQLPDVKDTKLASFYLAVAHVFQISMTFVDEEIEQLEKEAK